MIAKATPALRPPAFVYRHHRLYCESVPVARLAEEHGTPLYVYSWTAMRQRFEAFEKAFRRQPHTVCYSVKANSNLTILRRLAKLDSGFDVVSGGELERVKRGDAKAARRVVFSGVGKTTAEMDAALRSNILLFNVESAGEISALASRAAQMRRRARIALRVNPDVPAATHPYIATGLHQHKFGIPLGEAVRLYDFAARQPSLDVAGVSVHIGSQIMDVAPFRAAMTRVADLIRNLRSRGHDIRYLDAGGGLGVSYTKTGAPSLVAQVNSYAAAITQPLRDLAIHLLLEPGRWITAPAGALIVRVLYAKTNNSKRFAVVDGAMNDLIRPALYGAHHEIVRVALNGAGRLQAYDVVGPICETGDFFARDRKLPEVKEGELLAILDAGAYGMSIASNYNTRPRAEEVLVEGAGAVVIRRRETLADLLRQE